MTTVQGAYSDRDCQVVGRLTWFAFEVLDGDLAKAEPAGFYLSLRSLDRLGDGSGRAIDREYVTAVYALCDRTCEDAGAAADLEHTHAGRDR